MNKKTKKTRYKSKYPTRKNIKKFSAAGMYSDNTVAAAGQGSTGTTSNIVFDQSNPAVLQQKLQYLDDTKRKISSENDAVVEGINAQDQTDKANMVKAAQDSKAKFTAGETFAKEGLQKTTDWAKKLQELQTIKAGSDIGKTAGSLSPALQGIKMDPMQIANRTMTTPLPGANLGAPLNIPGGGAGGDYGLSSFSPPAPTLPGASVTGAVDAVTTGVDAATKGVDVVDKSTKAVKGAFDASKFTVDGAAAKGGIGAAIKAWKAQRATNQAIKAGTLMQSSAGTAAGAGWGAMSGAAKGNVIGAVAGLAGAGLKKWGGDDDDTELNAAEWGGDLLSGAGTGIGVASGIATIGSMVGAGALWGSAVPGLGTAIGAVAGLGYGAWKALTGRKKARAAEAEALAKKKAKVGKYNKKVTESLQSATLNAKAGEIEQKTYSGYDLGRNVTARQGGMRMGTPRYGYAAA